MVFLVSHILLKHVRIALKSSNKTVFSTFCGFIELKFSADYCNAGMAQPKFLDLFSGTGSVAKVARCLGYDVTTLDLQDADICCNILEWDYKAYNVGYFNVIWASPPCDTFSKAKLKNIGRNNVTKESINEDIINVGLPLLRRAQEILEYFQPTIWYIENPQTGRMKDFMEMCEGYSDVDYCQYSDWGYRKRTRIWHSKLGDQLFVPKLCPGKGKCEYMEGLSHVRASTGGHKNAKGQSSMKRRYAIPEKLLHNLIPKVSM